MDNLQEEVLDQVVLAEEEVVEEDLLLLVSVLKLVEQI
tara:strand:+ start:251 stop:364 length:114 start_codon:yes stop_codon:yes gene_type:complete